ncbi:hypothetical protein PENSPDRAFT_733113 [Peniophora sp. CONT]|nr:hypothetical protein PENSPDRAFT_733113 [Peniophora sp. CONT]
MMEPIQELSECDRTVYCPSPSPPPSPIPYTYPIFPPPPPRQVLIALRYKRVRVLVNIDCKWEATYEDVLKAARAVFPKLPADNNKICLETSIDIFDCDHYVTAARAYITPEAWPALSLQFGGATREVEIRTRQSKWERFIAAFK